MKKAQKNTILSPTGLRIQIRIRIRIRIQPVTPSYKDSFSPHHRVLRRSLSKFHAFCALIYFFGKKKIRVCTSPQFFFFNKSKVFKP